MIQIYSIGFGDDAVEIGYTDFPHDLRVEGQVIMMRQVQISLKHPDYREDAELLVGHARRMLANALEDFEESEPYEAPKDDDDEEDPPGMGE